MDVPWQVLTALEFLSWRGNSVSACAGWGWAQQNEGGMLCWVRGTAGWWGDARLSETWPDWLFLFLGKWWLQIDDGESEEEQESGESGEEEEDGDESDLVSLVAKCVFQLLSYW